MPIALKLGDESVDVIATVDTGSSHCLFERLHCELLRLDVEAGERRMFATAAGSVETYGHLVQIAFFDLMFESTVYFFADPAIKKNLLGRTGWLNRIRLGIVDHDRELYLAPYDS